MNVADRRKSVTYESTVAGSRSTVFEFRSMTAEEVFSVVGHAAGPLSVMIFDRTGIRNNADQETTLLNTNVDGSFSLDFRIPDDNDYFLVVDNEQGEAPVDFRFTALTEKEGI